MIKEIDVIEETIDTEIGKFKIMNHPKKSNLIFVQTHLPVTPEGEWEELGWMKKKDFFKMIKPHNPKLIIIPSYSTDVSKKSQEVSWKTSNSKGETKTPFSEPEIQNALPEITPEIVIQSTETPTKTIKKGVKMVPILKKKLSSKEKFSVEGARILGLCDGRHSVDDICEETKYSRLKVNDVIREHQKKDRIEVKRILIV